MSKPTASPGTTNTNTSLGNSNSIINNNNNNVNTSAASSSSSVFSKLRRGFHFRNPNQRFYKALLDGNVSKCRNLLQQGSVNVNIKDPDLERGRSPILTATRKGHVELVQLLLANGAAVNDTSAKTAETPLHICAWNGYLRVAQVLIRHHADVHATNNKGQTPLHHAAKCARIAMIRLLLQAGAKETVRDAYFETPLDIIRQRPRHNKARMEMEEIIQKEKPGGKGLPDTLLTIFFCKADFHNVPVWFDRMADAVQNVHECRLYYTIVRAALALQILPTSAAQAWIQKVLGQTALASKSHTSLHLLFLIVAKAYRDEMIDDAVYTKLNEYRKAKEDAGETTKAGISPDIRWTIKQSAGLMNGLEGTAEAVGLSLRFLFARMDLLRTSAKEQGVVAEEWHAAVLREEEQQRQLKDAASKASSASSGVESLEDSDAPLSHRFRKAREYAVSATAAAASANASIANHTLSSRRSAADLSQASSKLQDKIDRARLESMVGFMGVVLNSILMGVETYAASLNHLLQYVVDFGDPVHIQKIIACEFEYDKASALRKHVGYGVNVARRVAQIKVTRSAPTAVVTTDKKSSKESSKKKNAGIGVISGNVSTRSLVQEAEEYLQVVIGRKDPLVNLGFCTVILDAAKRIETYATSVDHANSDDDDQHTVLSKLSSDLEVLSQVSPLPSIGSADYYRGGGTSRKTRGGGPRP